MGLGFRKSFKIAPGVRVNVSNKSVGISGGVKGLRYSVNSRGQRRTTASIPGTGISYTSTSSSGRRYKSVAMNNRQQLIRQQKEIAKQEEIQRAKYEVEMYENKIELIHSIHKECDDTFDWLDISRSKHPHHNNQMGRYEIEAQHKLDSFKPSLIQKIMKSSNKAEQKLREELTVAKEADYKEFQELQRTIDIAKRVLDKDVETYLNIIEELSPLEDLLEFGSGFEFFIDDPEVLEVEFNVHSKNVVPTQIKSLTKTGKLSVKDMTKSKYYDICQDYVCSCAIRIARDMFAVLPFETVVVHAVDERLDTTTGKESMITILSVKFIRGTLNTLNFEAIDCSDSMINFVHNMDFKKTKGFLPVDKLNFI